MASRHRAISFAILIDTQGRFLFQQRDDVPGIVAPGKIGLFGGHCEGNETFFECVVREVGEETGLDLPRENFLHVASYRGPDVEIEGGWLSSECYVVRDVPVYGFDLPNVFRQAAVYADRILKGSSPTDLPVYQPTKFELVINLATARTLGMDVPLSLILRVDEMLD
jgi:8-oxo-dGTP pyrophosphatase MutT (NUDIX family)